MILMRQAELVQDVQTPAGIFDGLQSCHIDVRRLLTKSKFTEKSLVIFPVSCSKFYQVSLL